MSSNEDNWRGKRFFCSWSGVKDCSYALYKAIRAGAVPKVLLTMCTMDGSRTRTHNLPVSAVQAQAEAIGIQLLTQPCMWGSYDADFQEGVEKATAYGVDAGLTGDTEFGRKWMSLICAAYGLDPWLPLWEVDPVATFKELLGAGFKALVVAASDSKVGRELAGRTLDEDMVIELERKHVDVLGEYNEYHTFVTDGPIFAHPVQVVLGDVTFVDGYWLQEIGTCDVKPVSLG